MLEQSVFVSKAACPACRSAGGDKKGDNLAVYSDGHGYCFKCGYTRAGGASAPPAPLSQYKSKRKVEMTGLSGPIKDRGISQKIVEKFGVTLEHDKDGRVTRHHYPYRLQSSGDVVGTKVRRCETKDFYSTGTLEATGLFGQSIWAEGGRFVTITEGEIDAMAVAEMFDGKYPVVSIKRGAAAAAKDIKESLPWLETFDKVVICFDNDPAGQKASEEAMTLFSPGKAKVVTLPMKDAGEMLAAGKVQQFVKAWWDAKAYKPAGVVSLSDEACWDAFVNRGKAEIIPFPTSFGTLNRMMNGGMGAGEVTVIGALTSVGKTTFVTNLLYGLYNETTRRIGAVFLESSIGETTENVVSVVGGVNIKMIQEEDRDYTKYRCFYDEVKESDRIHIDDHAGSSDIEDLFARMRYLIKGLDCEVIILDPLQAAVQSNENGMIDSFMDGCLKLAKETNAAIIIVSHLRKPAVKDPHDVNEYDMKGSGSINQIAFNTILLSRDKLSEDDYERNCTKVQLVKCRRTGRTGHAGWLYFDIDTGRMVAGAAPEIQGVADEEF